ncbi:MAG: putative protein YisK [Candidatus Moanabacter tarae]|uniref:Fumarylacetoacetase-like C-terminal domain-containing protein n=1 Tax=Candidatus Moanibacter tarae TaxID=2200854 RepID=A0A2Z4ABC7_9BACT|nr:MAG: putative protein YisK [Candidatus Moanabacter tarae]|tara:strand:- start:2143 stop:3117 length:975 start_codon:yes stop_codon:yes gene_type:complete
MKLVSYTHKGSNSIGAVIAEDSILVDLAVADQTIARREKRKVYPFFSDMISLLEAGSKGIEAAKSAVASAVRRGGENPTADGKRFHRISSIRLRAPVPHPRAIYCLAGNYQDHIEEGGKRMQVQDKETPRVFMKPPATTVIGPGDRIKIPPIANSIDWEGELAVVMGRKAKGVKASAALRYVAGYTVMNDVSERKLLIRKRTENRERDLWFDWLNGKWLDTAGPQGPWIVTKDEIPDPQVLDISTYINGERRQHNNTGQMLYQVAQIIEYISAFLTLLPGDLISTGTVSGVGATTGEFLKPGDRVEIEISGIGRLRNRVAASRK